MAKQQGRRGFVDISTDGGTTWRRVAGLIDCTLNRTLDEVETTTHDSNGTKEFEPGLDEASFDMSVMYDDQDPAQLALEDSYDTKSTFLFRYFPVVLAGKRRYDGGGFVTSFSQAAPLNDMQTIDITVRVSGTITRETQT